jgi:NADH:ubiquinone oxidoreductase subunit 3 (subunit A)
MIINLLGLNSEQFSFNTSLFKEEYLGVLVYLIIAVLLALIIAILSYSLTSQKPESEKLSAYECGFEPYEDTRNKFDVKFCLVAILFILFDIEIVFLLPWSITLSQLNLLGFWSMIDFLLELGIGFIYVWKMQALDW